MVRSSIGDRYFPSMKRALWRSFHATASLGDYRRDRTNGGAGVPERMACEIRFYLARPMSSPLMVAVAVGRRTERVRFGTFRRADAFAPTVSYGHAERHLRQSHQRQTRPLPRKVVGGTCWHEHCRVAALPRPVKKPHPPLLLAENSDNTFDWSASLGLGVIGTTLGQPMPRLR
jgi:alkanesulfonate monooxygenase SsuD/methylene tetrahydromethanopterin reductase-like flavin-dependent oxidoreductase (luciferase family)